MRTTWNFYSAGQLLFGSGSVRQIGELTQRRQLRRVLVVTDQVLLDVGIVDQVREPLQQAGVEVELFTESCAEPSLQVADAAITAAKSFQPDAIIGLGGGSNMDLAKITAAVCSHGGAPADYFGFDKVPGPVLPLICVPTTAGTGSEVSHAAVLTDEANQIKVSTLSNYLRPALAIVDPLLTLSCPTSVTADSGIDALTHAIEAYTATDFSVLEGTDDGPCAYEGRYPLGDVLAEKAIALVGQHLITAVQEPKNQQAREGMSLAATLAGMAFSNCGVALVHALEYPLGGALHCSHGAGNGLLLPYVMRFNLPERTETFGRIAQLLGEETGGLAPIDAAEKAITAVEKLRQAIGIPARIRDIGGQESQLAGFAQKAFAIKRLLAVNPRRANEADLVSIYRDAL
ncbi:iron-containing alcohol dehydrogenase [Lignipirellula cremea]|uniref:1,3-propanediol dehydrogenase n=1 Tax=Lignipirellula cremea TaxID=2528010 RepID=A0A518DX19_9BACT|nr:iron-containing alcohol dehydrogenase [Lignipirellula cremea]QDU96383.1 1,3-propanediol dehydrogenase [Lignipirellula cremea]